MTKNEAKTALLEGKKLTHRHFSDGEHVFMNDGVIKFEDGAHQSQDEFWTLRECETWNEDWEVIE